MAGPETKPPAFYCPACGQKHRADLSALQGKPGAMLKATCRGCRAPLGVSVDEQGEAHCRPLGADAAASPDGTLTAQAGAPSPGPAAAPAAPPAAAPAASPAASPRSAAGAPIPSAGKGGGKGAEKAAGKAAGPLAATGKEPSAGKQAPAAPPGGAKGAAPLSARQAERGREREKERVAEDKRVADAEFAPGAVLGRYKVEEAIGRGGTGTVYRAFDPTTNRTVALKVLLADLSESMRQRFLREIEVQANIRHPNIMPVFDRGALPDGRPYFTMELLYKPFTLTEIVERRDRGTLLRYATLADFAELEHLVAKVLVPVAEGMYVANVENGVIHRDLKPDNVLVDSRTLRPYVIDFGICHVLERSGQLTSGTVVPPTAEDAGIVGTPRFLSPEQTRGSVHARTDVWGVGALLHFAITGEPPIAPASGITRTELARRVEALREAREAALAKGDEAKAAMCDEKLGRLQAEGLRTLDDLFKDAREGRYAPLPSSAPAALAAVVKKAMAPEPADRYVNVRQIAVELGAWVKGGQVRALSEAGGTAAAVDRAKRTLRGVLMPTLALLLGAAAGFSLGRMGRGPAQSEGLTGLDAEIADLKTELDAASRFAPRAEGPEAERLFAVLDLHARDLERRAQQAGSDSGIADRAAFQARRLLAPRVNIKAPEGLEWSAERPGLDGMVVRSLKLGDENRVPPGDWSVVGRSLDPELGRKVERVRVPLRVPLVVRDGGAGADREPAVQVVEVPPTAAALPAGMVLVAGDRVHARRAPWSEPSVNPTQVRTFLIGRAEVTNSEYAQFLRTLPEAEAKARTPEVGFVHDPNTGRSVGVRGLEDRPVVGLRPEDARAYATWRGTQDGGTYRLPTEAEWVVAAGGALGWTLPGGREGLLHEGVFQPSLAAAGAHDEDVGPHGERGLLANAREMVEPSEGDLPPGTVLVKGAGVGDRPSEAAIYKVRTLGPAERDPVTGFRLARSIAP